MIFERYAAALRQLQEPKESDSAASPVSPELASGLLDEQHSSLAALPFPTALCPAGDCRSSSAGTKASASRI